MPLTDPPDTLSYHASRVFTTNRDMQNTSMSDVSSRMKDFMAKDKNDNTVPEQEAIAFYGLNHGMALLAAEKHPLEPLNNFDLNLVREYHGVLGPKAVRAFVYLMLICTREARHCKAPSKVQAYANNQGWHAAANFYKGGSGESDVHNQLMNNPPDCTVGQWVKTLHWGYYNSQWGGGYGGPKWGVVTDCLVRFVTGEFTAEMMMDTVWTLAHNGGPIFNKGHCYTCHESYVLRRVLDVQRSGQIPELVLNGEINTQYVPSGFKTRMTELFHRFPGKIGGYVDWHKVEALGSIGKYHNEKAEQDKKHADPTTLAKNLAEQAAKDAALAKQKEDEKAKKALSAAEFAAKHFEVMPGVHVEKISMDREAQAA